MKDKTMEVIKNSIKFGPEGQRGGSEKSREELLETLRKLKEQSSRQSSEETATEQAPKPESSKPESSEPKPEASNAPKRNTAVVTEIADESRGVPKEQNTARSAQNPQGNARLIGGNQSDVKYLAKMLGISLKEGITTTTKFIARATRNNWNASVVIAKRFGKILQEKSVESGRLARALTERKKLEILFKSVGLSLSSRIEYLKKIDEKEHFRIADNYRIIKKELILEIYQGLWDIYVFLSKIKNPNGEAIETYFKPVIDVEEINKRFSRTHTEEDIDNLLEAIDGEIFSKFNSSKIESTDEKGSKVEIFTQLYLPQLGIKDENGDLGDFDTNKYWQTLKDVSSSEVEAYMNYLRFYFYYALQAINSSNLIQWEDEKYWYETNRLTSLIFSKVKKLMKKYDIIALRSLRDDEVNTQMLDNLLQEALKSAPEKKK